jgi:fructose-bisphosphate aldolase class II
MPLVKTLDILKKCEDEKFAVGAFNINGLDQPAALIKKAEELKSPILVVIPGVIEKYVNFEDFTAVTMRAAAEATVPVGIHLSHAGDLAQFERACKAGFTSVMYDGSKLPYDENVRNTKEAVMIGHKYGAAVEGELGALGSSFANASESMTDPALSKDFVEKTGVDILAVAIGNAHGFYKGKPSIDFKRLDEIRYALLPKNVYITLHGGTGIPEDQIRRCIDMGITKICIYTEMCSTGKEAAKKYIAEHPDYEGNYDIPELIGGIIKGFTEAEEASMRMFMSIGRCGKGDNFASLPAKEKAACKAESLSLEKSVSAGVVLNTDIGPEYPSKIAQNKAFSATGIYWHKNV